MRNFENCPICNSLVNIVEQNCPGYMLGLNFQIYQCEKCNTSFSLPYYGAEDIYNNIYKNAQNIQGYDRYFKLYNIIKSKNNPADYLKNTEETYYSSISIIEDLYRINPQLNVLEIGSGLGYFSYAIKRLGVDITGIDISHEAVTNAKRNFGDFFQCINIFDEKFTLKYDVIIANQLIEHIENPVEFIIGLKSKLKEKGKIVLTTPNKSIYPQDAVWKTTDLPPVHCFWFSEQSFIAIASILNFNITFFDFSSWYNLNKKFIGYTQKNTTNKCLPVLNDRGEPIQSTMTSNKVNFDSKKKTKNSFRSNLNKYGLYRKLKYLFCGYYYKCSSKGDTICVILENK